MRVTASTPTETTKRKGEDMTMTAEQIRAAFRAGEVSGSQLLCMISEYVAELEGQVSAAPEPAHASDLDLLAKFVMGNGGRRTGRLMALGYIKVEVTTAGYRALGPRLKTRGPAPAAPAAPSIVCARCPVCEGPRDLPDSVPCSRCAER